MSYVQRIHDDILASARYNRLWGKDYIWWLPHTAVLAREDIYGEDAIMAFFQVCPSARQSGLAMGRGHGIIREGWQPGQIQEKVGHRNLGALWLQTIIIVVVII